MLDVRQTGPRIIYIRSMPSIKGWLKADWKGTIDHENDDDFTSTLELQLGHMLTPGIGLFAEALLGDDVLETDQYDIGLGVGVRILY